MNYRTLDIKVTGPTPSDVKVLLDGVEQKNWKSVLFEAGMSAVPLLTMTSFPDPRRGVNEK